MAFHKAVFPFVLRGFFFLQLLNNSWRKEKFGKLHLHLKLKYTVIYQSNPLLYMAGIRPQRPKIASTSFSCDLRSSFCCLDNDSFDKRWLPLGIGAVIFGIRLYFANRNIAKKTDCITGLLGDNGYGMFGTLALTSVALCVFLLARRRLTRLKDGMLKLHFWNRLFLLGIGLLLLCKLSETNAWRTVVNAFVCGPIRCLIPSNK